MKRQNYSDEYIRLNRSALRTLTERGANLFDIASVKELSPNKNGVKTEDAMLSMLMTSL